MTKPYSPRRGKIGQEPYSSWPIHMAWPSQLVLRKKDSVDHVDNAIRALDVGLDMSLVPQLHHLGGQAAQDYRGVLDEIGAMVIQDLPTLQMALRSIA